MATKAFVSSRGGDRAAISNRPRRHPRPLSRAWVGGGASSRGSLYAPPRIHGSHLSTWIGSHLSWFRIWVPSSLGEHSPDARQPFAARSSNGSHPGARQVQGRLLPSGASGAVGADTTIGDGTVRGLCQRQRGQVDRVHGPPFSTPVVVPPSALIG